MLFACMRAELMKLKRSFIWSVFLILPVISTIMGCFNYLQNTDIVGVSWYSLWTQTTLFYSNFFYAPLIAVYCAYLWLSLIHIYFRSLWPPASPSPGCGGWIHCRSAIRPAEYTRGLCTAAFPVSYTHLAVCQLVQ